MSDWSLPNTAHRVAEQSFDAQGAGHLHLQVPGARVRLTPAEARLTIQSYLTAPSADQAQQRMRTLPLSTQQAGADIHVQWEADARATDARTQWLRRWNESLGLFLDIALPSAFRATLHMAGGGCWAHDLSNTLALHVSGGRLSLASPHGPVNIEAHGATVACTDVHGPLTLHGAGSDLSLHRLQADTTVHAAGGALTVSEATAPLTLFTNGVALTLHDATCAERRTNGQPVAA
ncbi:hypothetical protein [Salisaeta longa]|uniref:hypothetical protein n=1 Tax=Salisaeta longa TaxID=503170 RepID=UPI0003B52B90|nr:hypothetical protein [Salisaeta longa]